MAIWQFECSIVPLNDNIHGDIVFWGKDIKNTVTDIQFLKRERSWSQNIIQYGKLDETCIEFIYNQDILEEISCRLDLRSLKKQTLLSLLEYVKKNEALFLVDNELYPPNIDVIVELLKYSKANQYCKSPLNFINSLDKGK